MRINIVVDIERKNKWPKLAKKIGFGSVSQMVRFAVDNLEKQEIKGAPITKAVKPIRDGIGGIYDLLKNTNEMVDIIHLKLENSDPQSVVNKAAKDIIFCLLKSDNEKNFAELTGKLGYSYKTLRQAIALLSDLGIIGSHLNKK